MNKWCSELDVLGLVKSGYPGFLCFDGGRDGVDEIVRRIKALQWHAITVKTDVPYDVQCKGGEAGESILQAGLARGHSSVSFYQAKPAKSKVRASMDEIEDTGRFVQRSVMSCFRPS